MKKNYFRKHCCGDGFRGKIVRSHSIVFCGLCGHEYRG